MWNFDIKDRNPFLCDKQGNVRVIDTSGFQALRRSQAESLMKGFYEKEMVKLEEAVRAEVIASQPDPLKPEEREEYERLSGIIEELKAKGQELLVSLGIRGENYITGDTVRRSLASMEADLDREPERKKSAERRLAELQRKKDEANREKKTKAQARDAEKRIKAAETNSSKAQSQDKKLIATEELKALAAKVIASGNERIDDETSRKLRQLQLDSGIRSSSYGVDECREIIEKIRTLEEEKPLTERKEEAQRQIETAKAELDALHRERDALGKVSEISWIFEPRDSELERAREEIKRLRTDKDIKSLREDISKIRKVIEQINKHSSLNFKVEYSQKQAKQRADATIEELRYTLFEEELPRSTNKKLTQINIGELLKECGFETFLKVTGLAELKSLYEQVIGSRYHIDNPRIILDIIISQLEKSKASEAG